MSLVETLLFYTPPALPAGPAGAGKPARRQAQTMSVYRQQQAQGRAANLERLVAAIAAGASTKAAIARASGLSFSMVKKALPELEAARRIVRTNGRHIPHQFAVAPRGHR